MDKEQGNKLIAEFMGKRRVYESTEDIFIENLKYHSSWDWLMPVVEKIETMNDCSYSITLHFGMAFINDEGYRPHRILIRATGSNRLETTYNLVIKFIQWLNNQTPKP